MPVDERRVIKELPVEQKITVDNSKMILELPLGR